MECYDVQNTSCLPLEWIYIHTTELFKELFVKLITVLYRPDEWTVCDLPLCLRKRAKFGKL